MSFAVSCRASGAGWHSDHLSFSGLGGAVLHDLLPVPFTRSTARRVAARVREASERIERPMVVEKLSYYDALGSSPLDEPEFITEVLEKSGAGLLLDLSNVFVNAKNHGFDTWQWLARIPLERVVEIHVAGPEPWLLLDTHGAAIRAEVFELLDWTIERTGPVPVLLERDHNVPALAELLTEHARVDAVYQAALARRGPRAEVATHAA
jgi:uncharacterized protein